MHKWYVVHVLSGKEKKVRRALEEHTETAGLSDLIEEVVLPTENVFEVKRGEQKISEKRMWPGYLLMKMTLTDDSWMYVKNTNGVIGFLGGEKPTSLTEEEVRDILEDIEEKKEKVVQKHQFEVGDAVKIVDGVFVNFMGNIVELFHDKGRLSVVVSIFGRETRVDDLELWQVEELATDTEEV
jgi:transcriptional antiterminator NusG